MGDSIKMLSALPPGGVQCAFECVTASTGGYRHIGSASFISNERDRRVRRFNSLSTQRTPKRDGLDRSCSILGDNLLLSDTYGNDEKLQTFGGCGSNSVCMVWRRKCAGRNEHHHRRRTAIQVVRTRERHLQIPRNGLGGVRCSSAQRAVGHVDGPCYL